MNLFIIIASVLLAAVCYVNGQSCTTVNDDSGNCVSIYNCPSLLQLLDNARRSPDDVDVLRKSACGFEGNMPKVCCPLTRTIAKDNCDSIITAHPPDPKTECCGHQTAEVDKITIGGGNSTKIDEYPWLTLIEYLSKDNRIKLLCGGVLISNKYVLTAAHCLTGSVLDVGTPKNVRLGEYDTNHEGPDCVITLDGGIDCTDGIVVIRIQKTIPHAEYNPLTKQHDIGLIRMQQAAPYTDFIRPICLPADDVTVKPPRYFELFAAGWGAINSTHTKSSIKLHVGLPYVNLTECQPAYNVRSRQVTLGKGHICAGGQVGKDSCKGDSGGPLMYGKREHFEVLGIVSFGPTPCGKEHVPGVYSKVIEYVSWINGNIEA